jgi:hypothetical protein
LEREGTPVHQRVVDSKGVSGESGDDAPEASSGELSKLTLFNFHFPIQRAGVLELLCGGL